MIAVTVTLPLPSSQKEGASITQFPDIMGELIGLLRSESVLPEPSPVFWMSFEEGRSKVNARGWAPLDGTVQEADIEKWNTLLE